MGRSTNTYGCDVLYVYALLAVKRVDILLMFVINKAMLSKFKAF